MDTKIFVIMYRKYVLKYFAIKVALKSIYLFIFNNPLHVTDSILQNLQ